MGRQEFSRSALAGVHIVVVDDDADARTLLQTVLEYAGALVTAASSASDGVDTLQRIWPDVFVTDISMPGRDGYWLLREVRAVSTRRGRGLPVVALSAYRREHTPDAAAAAGFDAYLTKPIDPWELCRVVAGLAGHRTPAPEKDG